MPAFLDPLSIVLIPAKLLKSSAVSWIPFESISIGVTLKYLQGLFYMGIDPDSSSANIITSDIGLYGGGKYLIRQGIGG